MAGSLSYAYIMRRKMMEMVQSLTIRQLNEIPEGFNNNIAWHFGHIVVSTQLLCYVRTGVQPHREIPFADKYRNGSRPEGFIDQGEIDYLCSVALSDLDELVADNERGVFEQIEPYATHTFGTVLTDIEAVFECCAFHDTVHAGSMMAMRKLV